MKITTIPATAFPILQQIAVNQTSLREFSFETYLKLTELIQHVFRMRSFALSLLINTKSKTNSLVLTDYLNVLQNAERLDHHGVVYYLYLLGAYKEASQFVETHFKRNNEPLEKRIQEIKTELSVNQGETMLKDILKSCLIRERLDPITSTRIKSPGSLFAKIISINKLNFETLVTMSPEELSENNLPYDLIGGSILVNNLTNQEFNYFIDRIVAYFEKKGLPLVDQNVYSPSWMKRKSLIGSIELNKKSIPFQLHIWDKIAERYEYLSYGNYKMNKIFCPVLIDWQSYIKKELSEIEYSKILISNLLKC